MCDATPFISEGSLQGWRGNEMFASENIQIIIPVEFQISNITICTYQRLVRPLRNVLRFRFPHGTTLCVIHKLLFQIWVSCICLGFLAGFESQYGPKPCANSHGCINFGRGGTK
ncbi:hypothetical protein SFRURICE_004445 [Spodoptera frugiperda]|nr:hypothetical protein SFRURICE_004445 [Spodoptera frugiperda]